MLDVGRRFGDVRAYVTALETLIVDALAQLGVEARPRSGLVGVWVRGARAGSASGTTRSRPSACGCGAG